MKSIVFVVFILFASISSADSDIGIGDSNSRIVIFRDGETEGIEPKDTGSQSEQVEAHAVETVNQQRRKPPKKKYSKPTITNIQSTYLGKPDEVAREVQSSIFSQTA